MVLLSQSLFLHDPPSRCYLNFQLLVSCEAAILKEWRKRLRQSYRVERGSNSLSKRSPEVHILFLHSYFQNPMIDHFYLVESYFRLLAWIYWRFFLVLEFSSYSYSMHFLLVWPCKVSVRGQGYSSEAQHCLASTRSWFNSWYQSNNNNSNNVSGRNLHTKWTRTPKSTRYCTTSKSRLSF